MESRPKRASGRKRSTCQVHLAFDHSIGSILMTNHPAKEARKAKAPDAICSLAAMAVCPMAISQYDPVKITKVMKRPKKMVTNTKLVRNAQIK